MNSPDFLLFVVISLLVVRYRLETMGFGIGQRVIELISCRDRLTKRETRIVNMLQVLTEPLFVSYYTLRLKDVSLKPLQYVSNVLWKYLFGKAADNLERSMENEDECK